LTAVRGHLGDTPRQPAAARPAPDEARSTRTLDLGWWPLTVGRCCCRHRCCQLGPGPSQLDLGGHRQRA
jgi:hypothetical protein